jgi:acyl carrier protein
MALRWVTWALSALILLGSMHDGLAANCSNAVRQLISEHMNLPLARIVPAANFRVDLKADDLDMIEIVIAAEEEFGLVISEADEKRLITVRDLIVHVNERAKTGCQ